MRFLFYTDLQLSGKSPRSRVDDYPRALLAKLAETYKVASREGCDFVVFGGDFFNGHHVYSYDVIGEAMDVVCDSGLTTYMVVGQHDLHGYNPETLRTSTLGFVLGRCPDVKVLWEDLEVGYAILRPCHVWDDLEVARDAPRLKGGGCEILVAHHLLSDGKKMFDIVPTAEFGKDCVYDLVLSGDLHCGFETHEVDGTVFCNPGSLARQAKNEVDRMPRVAVVTVEQSRPEIEMVMLECAEEGRDVFVEEDVEEDGDEPFDAEAFVTEVAAFQGETVDFHELVGRVGRASGIRPEVLGYLDSKRAEMADAGT